MRLRIVRSLNPYAEPGAALVEIPLCAIAAGELCRFASKKLVFIKQAQIDAKKLSAAGLRAQARVR